MCIGLPVARNQTLIMNHLIEQQTDSRLLQEGLHTDLTTLPEHQQRKEAALVDLIAQCCVGFNRATKSPAQGFFSLPQTLDLLCSSGTVQLEYRIPYMRFMCEVWPPQTSADDGAWFKNETFWFVLDHFLGFLESFNKDVIDFTTGSVETHLRFIYEGIIPIVTMSVKACDRYPALHPAPTRHASPQDTALHGIAPHHTTPHHTVPYQVTDAPEARERALQHPRELPPAPVLRYMGTDIFLQGKPMAPQNISAIKAEIWQQMKPQHMAPDAAMMVLEAKVMPRPACTAASVYRPTATVQHANDGLYSPRIHGPSTAIAPICCAACSWSWTRWACQCGS